MVKPRVSTYFNPDIPLLAYPPNMHHMHEDYLLIDWEEAQKYAKDNINDMSDIHKSAWKMIEEYWQRLTSNTPEELMKWHKQNRIDYFEKEIGHLQACINDDNEMIEVYQKKIDELKKQ